MHIFAFFVVVRKIIGDILLHLPKKISIFAHSNFNQIFNHESENRLELSEKQVFLD